MEIAADIWNEYLRLNLYLIFFAGLAIVNYRIRDRWKEFRRMQQIPSFSRTWAVLWPNWAWMLVFGVPATIADVVFTG